MYRGFSVFSPGKLRDSRGEKSREVEEKAHGQVRVFCFVYTWQDHRNLERALVSVPISLIAMSTFCARCLPAKVGMETSHTHSHPRQALKLECGTASCAQGILGTNALLECVLSYFSQQFKRTQPLFPQRFSLLSHPPNLAQASWSCCYESKRLEKAQAATGLHLKGPRPPL